MGVSSSLDVAGDVGNGHLMWVKTITRLKKNAGTGGTLQSKSLQ